VLGGAAGAVVLVAAALFFWGRRRASFAKAKKPEAGGQYDRDGLGSRLLSPVAGEEDDTELTITTGHSSIPTGTSSAQRSLRTGGENSNTSGGGGGEESQREREDSSELFNMYTGAPINAAAKLKCKREWTTAGEADSVRELAYAELEAATSGFSEGNRLGKGASCEVYSGELFGLAVAVKIMSVNADEWSKQQFVSEMDMLCTVQHVKICRLFAYSR
jgi:hypothetical protein